MKQKILIIVLSIFLAFFLLSTLVLLYQNINYSLENYTLRFLLDSQRNESSKMKFDRYDAYKQLTSLSCYRDYNQGFTVFQGEDPNYWHIKLQGYITNPQTGEENKDHLSTLGNYLVDKETGNVLNYPMKSENICNLNLEDAENEVKKLSCVQEILNRKEVGIVAIEVAGIQDTEELYTINVTTTRSPGVTSTSLRYSVNKYTGEILQKDSLNNPKILCED